MATRIKEWRTAPYEGDFYAWAREQAALLRAGRYEELDLEHLIEEVDDLGESLYRSVRSRVRTIIEHLLNLQHSPAPDPRNLWHDTIAAQRSDLEDDLTPSLRTRIEAELPKQYGRARGRSPLAPAARRERCCRRAARDVSLSARPDRRRLAALSDHVFGLSWAWAKTIGEPPTIAPISGVPAYELPWGDIMAASVVVTMP